MPRSTCRVSGDSLWAGKGAGSSYCTNAGMRHDAQASQRRERTNEKSPGLSPLLPCACASPVNPGAVKVAHGGPLTTSRRPTYSLVSGECILALYIFIACGTVVAQSHVRQQSAAALAAGHGAGAVLATCACCHSWATTWRRVGPSWSGWAYWTGCAAPRPCRCCGAAAAGRSRAFSRRARRETEGEDPLQRQRRMLEVVSHLLPSVSIMCTCGVRLHVSACLPAPEVNICRSSCHPSPHFAPDFPVSELSVRPPSLPLTLSADGHTHPFSASHR